jgi:hypothetical protein
MVPQTKDILERQRQYLTDLAQKSRGIDDPVESDHYVDYDEFGFMKEKILQNQTSELIPYYKPSSLKVNLKVSQVFQLRGKPTVRDIVLNQQKKPLSG